MLALLIELCFMLALPDWSVTCACPTWLKCDLCLPYLSEVWPVLALPVWGVACACPTCLMCGLCLPYLSEVWPVLALPDWMWPVLALPVRGVTCDWGVACACPTWLRCGLCLPNLTEVWPVLALPDWGMACACLTWDIELLHPGLNAGQVSTITLTDLTGIVPVHLFVKELVAVVGIGILLPVQATANTDRHCTGKSQQVKTLG